MTKNSPRIYIYKITFEEVLYYYYGVHKEKVFDEEYWGTPITHKWCWDFYTPKKQILQFFDFTDEGWLEAQKVETRLIKPFFNADKWCLNEGCGGIFSLDILRNCGKITGKKMREEGKGIFAQTPEQRSLVGKIGGSIVGNKIKEEGSGIFGLSPEEKNKNCKKGGEKAKELGVGIHGRTKEEMQENGRKSGQKTYKNGTGIHSLTPEQKSEAGKRGGKRAKELGVGLHSFTAEQRIENARLGGIASCKIINSQRWMCEETGYISTPAGLSKYQKHRGINTSKRVRIS